SFYRRPIRSFADSPWGGRRFVHLPTTPRRQLLRSFTDHFVRLPTLFVLSPTTSYLCRPIRTSGDRNTYICRRHFVHLATEIRTYGDGAGKIAKWDQCDMNVIHTLNLSN